jgi:aspartate/methionine/tyrosine aminotransferase
VALTPGEAFDAPGFLRISYATSMDRLRVGATRILDFVRKLDAAGETAEAASGV